MYDGEDVVLVYAGSSAGSLTNRYLVGPNTDEILADENAAGVVTWSLADNLGTVRDLAQYNTGTNTTTVVNHVKYDTFGQIKSQTNSAWQPLFAYTGREWDGDAGMYYYRARWYDARVGRFLSEDPIGFAAGDVNLSRYVANRATMWVDPSGLAGEPALIDYTTSKGTFIDLNVPVDWWPDTKITVALRPKDGKGLIERRVKLNSKETVIYYLLEEDLLDLVADAPTMVGKWKSTDWDKWFADNALRMRDALEADAEKATAAGDLPTAAYKYATSREMQPVGEAAVATGELIVKLQPTPAVRATPIGYLPPPSPVVPKGKPLVRYGGPVTPKQLAEQAAAAAANPAYGVHGVSVILRNPPKGPHGQAAFEEAMKQFGIRQTGPNKSHYTVFIPEKVTQEVADRFNSLFQWFE